MPAELSLFVSDFVGDYDFAAIFDFLGGGNRFADLLSDFSIEGSFGSFDLALLSSGLFSFFTFLGL